MRKDYKGFKKIKRDIAIKWINDITKPGSAGEYLMGKLLKREGFSPVQIINSMTTDQLLLFGHMIAAANSHGHDQCRQTFKELSVSRVA
jgi:hypothetical protein